MNKQLALSFKAGSDQRFVDYLENDDARRSLELAAEGHFEHNIFVAGGQGSGKSHLLRAAAAHALALGRSAVYVPVLKVAAHLPQVLEGFEQHALICLDDIDSIAGKSESEIALFHFFNRAQAAGARMVFSANAMPSGIGIELPDLVSRLEQSVRFNLNVLNEQAKRYVVLQRAKSRGLELDDAVLDYLFSRVSRDLHTLNQLLDRLDHASLAAQRRITVPFIKTVLNA